MNIIAKQKIIDKFKKIKTPLKDITFTVDDVTPIIMAKLTDGRLVEYLRGEKQISNFLKYGYNRIIKQCPMRHRKCIGEKCQLYVIANGTGDCAITWNTILNIEKGVKE